MVHSSVRGPFLTYRPGMGTGTELCHALQTLMGRPIHIEVAEAKPDRRGKPHLYPFHCPAYHRAVFADVAATRNMASELAGPRMQLGHGPQCAD